MTVLLRPVRDDDADLAAYAAVVNAVSPDSPTSLEEMRWEEATYPGGRRFVAEANGTIVGAAKVARIYMYPPEFERLWFGIEVLPEHRRQGIGTALLREIGAHTRSVGKTGLETTASEARPDGIAFLEHHGFTAIERSKSVRLDLEGLAPEPVQPPDGIEFTTLADRPDLVTGVHDVALNAFPDIPSADEPISVGDLAEFRKRDVDRPGIPHDGFFVAVDAATGEAVGYAALMFQPGSREVAWHDMTAVKRSHRGRGIAVALKRATIHWAVENGLTALETGNDESNAPMRAVNARLGYRPLPDLVEYSGPLPALDQT
jgi:GNAT superfamily N-acetyltransferase